LSLIERFVTKDDFREMLGLLRINGCGSDLSEFSGNRSLDPVRFDAKRGRNLPNRELHPMTLVFSHWGFDRPACRMLI
jgi:hypothetical protein